MKTEIFVKVSSEGNVYVMRVTNNVGASFAAVSPDGANLLYLDFTDTVMRGLYRETRDITSGWRRMFKAETADEESAKAFLDSAFFGSRISKLLREAVFAAEFEKMPLAGRVVNPVHDTPPLTDGQTPSAKHRGRPKKVTPAASNS